MVFSFKQALAAGVVCGAMVVSHVASAQNSDRRDSRYYFGLEGAMALVSDNEFDGALLDGDLSTSIGYAVNAAFGYNITSQIRAEIEVGRQVVDANELTFTNVGNFALTQNVELEAEGEISAWTFMANGFYDFKIGKKFRPYLGAGIGFAYISADVAAANVRIVDDSTLSIGYQAAAGFAYNIRDEIDLTLGYSYRGFFDSTFDDVQGSEFDASYGSHLFRIGFRSYF